MQRDAKCLDEWRAFVLDDQCVIEEVYEARWSGREENVFGEEPRLVGAEFFESCGLDDHGGYLEYAGVQQGVGTMVAVAQEPASAKAGDFKEGTAGVDAQWRDGISSCAQMQIWIR